ncbi:MAG: chromosomal replication initiator protein DnaA [Armatimonadetes bacterium]|nr:chromosomal replication initiator protein DnaA [Armatimonadota bacterium]
MKVGNVATRSPDQLILDKDDRLPLLIRAWNVVLPLIKNGANKSSVAHILQMTPVALTDDRAVFALPGQFSRNWVMQRESKRIEAALNNELGQNLTLELVASDNEQPEIEPTVAVAREPASQPKMPRPKLNSKFSFAQFVEGASNRLAVAGAKAAAANPGAAHNPLFLYGPPGVGKTHLLQAIGNETLKRDKSARVIYISAQDFLLQYVDAIKLNKMDAFRALHHSVTLWLIDDVQTLGGRDRTQEEFFHIYNFLYQSDRQIVMTSDRPPMELDAVSGRLKTRFEQGLCADIAQPDLELRIAILKKKSEGLGLALPDEAVLWIAEKAQANARSLQGALTRLATFASIHQDSPFTLELTIDALRGYLTDCRPERVSIDQILKAVCETANLTPEQLTKSGRKAEIARIRQIAMFLARELTHEPWARIAVAFGRSDHTTAIHAYETVNRLRAQDADLDARIAAIKRKLYAL